jgi:nucleoside phosphorylase/CheY-like chemotaxis protein
MISILIVDDIPTKVSAIEKLLLAIPPLTRDDITVAPDIITAKRLLIEKQFDLLILDLSLPQRFGENPDDDGGVTFLEDLSTDPTLIPPFHIVGLTEHPRLNTKHSGLFISNLWYLITYDAQYRLWEEQISNYARYLIKSKMELLNPSNVKYDYDLAIVTILNETELQKVKELDGHWTEQKFPNDSTFYYTGYFEKDDRNFSVVVASTDNAMGMPAASVLSMKLIQRFRPKYICMAGICAGLKGKGNIGDPIMADRVWDYGSGKHIIKTVDRKKVEAFKPYINQIALDKELSSQFSNIISKNLYFSEIQSSWKNTYNDKLIGRIGPFASGSAVIANENKLNEIKEQHGQLVGFDMESYAVFYAADNCSYPKPTPFIIKSISDFGDSHKNNPRKDEFQEYAAFTSAQLLYHFAINHL